MSDQEALEAEEQISERVAEEASQADEAPAADEDLEVVELELSDDDIVRYLEDDQGNRIGFVIMEDGEEAEYLYVEATRTRMPAAKSLTMAAWASRATACSRQPMT